MSLDPIDMEFDTRQPLGGMIPRPFMVAEADVGAVGVNEFDRIVGRNSLALVAGILDAIKQMLAVYRVLVINEIHEISCRVRNAVHRPRDCF